MPPNIDLPQDNPSLHKCPFCDLALSIEPINATERAICPRCNAILQVGSRLSNEQLFCMSLTALILLWASFPLRFISININGQYTVLTLMNSISGVHHYDRTLLAVTLLSLTFIIPSALLISASGMYYILWRRRLMNLFPIAFRVFSICHKWLMVDVFVIGVLVSLMKISSMAKVNLGISFFLYCIFVCITLLLFTRVQPESLWQQWERSV